MSGFPKNNFTILITTRNRLEELQFTLKTLETLKGKGVKIIICDDGSKDGTSEFIKSEYPKIELIVNPVNKGLIYSRNLLMSQVETPYAISLDDDANFSSESPLEGIAEFFGANPRCAVIGFRIYWGLESPKKKETSQSPIVVKSFVGCGHVWRMAAWKDIPDYPEWYEFYGEENFASFHLFKREWEVHYLPSVFVHHRVDNKARKKNVDYYLRARRSLRADWYNYFIFYPKKKLVRSFVYSVKMQVLKVKKQGDYKILMNLILALRDIFLNFKKIKRSRDSLKNFQYQRWVNLSDAQIYWNPKPTSTAIQKKMYGR